MAQRLLHHQQHVTPGLGEHHAVRMQPGAGEGGGEHVRLGDGPQHRAPPPGQQAGQQQRGGGAVLEIGPFAGRLVQRAGQQAAAGQVPVDRGHAEAQGVGGRMRGGPPLDAGDARAQHFQRFGLCLHRTPSLRERIENIGRGGKTIPLRGRHSPRKAPPSQQDGFVS